MTAPKEAPSTSRPSTFKKLRTLVGHGWSWYVLVCLGMSWYVWSQVSERVWTSLNCSSCILSDLAISSCAASKDRCHWENRPYPAAIALKLTVPGWSLRPTTHSPVGMTSNIPHSIHLVSWLNYCTCTIMHTSSHFEWDLKPLVCHRGAYRTSCNTVQDTVPIAIDTTVRKNRQLAACGITW